MLQHNFMLWLYERTMYWFTKAQCCCSKVYMRVGGRSWWNGCTTRQTGWFQSSAPCPEDLEMSSIPTSPQKPWKTSILTRKTSCTQARRKALYRHVTYCSGKPNPGPKACVYHSNTVTWCGPHLRLFNTTQATPHHIPSHISTIQHMPQPGDT
jgi:hypothetical protein